jgi:hypothetical protein
VLVLANYANRPYRLSQQLNARSGLEVGGVDVVRSFSPRQLDAGFRRRNAHILRARRGAGYFLWKPYVVERVLAALEPGDWLFYTDSGVVFVDSVRHLVDFANERELDVLCFETPFLESQFTKRDAFVLLDCDEPRFADSRHRLAGFSLWRASDSALTLARSWLTHAQDPRAITDAANELGKPNYPGWVEHRWDQSIFSLLTKREGLPAFRDPSQHGLRWLADYPESTYPQIVDLTRARTPPLRGLVRDTIRRRIHDLGAGRVKDAIRPPSRPQLPSG